MMVFVFLKPCQEPNYSDMPTWCNRFQRLLNCLGSSNFNDWLCTETCEGELFRFGAPVRFLAVVDYVVDV